MTDTPKIWRCDDCRTPNPENVLKCRACEKPQPGLSEEQLAKLNAPSSAVAALAAFKESTAKSSTNFFASTSAGSTGFAFGTTSSTDSTSAPSTGFAFQPSTSTSDSTSTGFAFTPSASTFAFGTKTDSADDKSDDKSTASSQRKRKADDTLEKLTSKTSKISAASPKLNVKPVKGKGKGIVFPFGSGDMSQLGLGVDMRERRFPTLLKALQEKDIVQIASGALHNLALDSEGVVYSWGCNDDGALGRKIENDEEEFTPMPVAGLDDVKIIQVSCGASHSLAVSDEGAVYSWGAYRDASGLVGFDRHEKICYAAHRVQGIPEKVIKTAAGESHSLALTSTGKVYYWGDVYIGRRASDRTKRNRLHPSIVPVTTRVDRTRPTIAKTKEDVRIVDIFSGGYTCFGVSATGLLWVWGPNNYTQCGIARIDEEDQAIVRPTVVPYFATRGIKVKAAAAASQFSVVLTEDHRVFAFGRVADGRLGQDEDHVFADKHEQVVPIEVKGASPAFLSSKDSWEQEAEHFKQEKHPLVTTQADDHVVALSCGETHTLAVTARGRAISWGNGDLLQLGNGIEQTVYTPYWIRSHAITTTPRYVVQATGGSQHSMILAKNAE